MRDEKIGRENKDKINCNALAIYFQQHLSSEYNLPLS